jgi:phosphatidylserine/phosphatidylglycerophosphate/cardiolipin synthase-like enzyme
MGGCGMGDAIAESTERMDDSSRSIPFATIRNFHTRVRDAALRRKRPATDTGYRMMETTIYCREWARSMALDMHGATSSITLTALSYLPPRTLGLDEWSAWQIALDAARHRAILVVIMLPAPSTAHPATLRNQYAADIMRKMGATVALIPATNLLHAKTCLIDGRIAWVGSGNLTAAAAHHNRETYIRTTADQATRDLFEFHQLTFSDRDPRL